MIYQSIILSHITEYCQKKKWIYKSNRGSVSILCPFCKNDAMTARIIAKTYKMKCLNPDCQKKFSLISIVRANEKDKKDKDKISKEFILQYLKKLLNISVITALDEKEIDKLFDIYERNGWSLVPITRNSKIPCEKAWTEKEHKDKKEWLSWIKDSRLNVGVRTGKVSNLTILDLDIKEIPQELKPLLGETLTQKSTKGFHFCYQYEKELPKGRIDKYKLDIENSSGQVIISPSSINGIPRKWINDKPIIQMPKELKEFLLANIKAPKKTLSEKISYDIRTESYKNPLIEEGEGRNELLVRLGGILRKQLPETQVEYSLNVLNKVICNPSLSFQEMRAMFGSLEKYTEYDEKELAHEIMKYLKHTKTADRLELIRAMKEDNKKIAQVLDYLVREEKITKAGKYYSLLDKPEWKTALIDAGKPIDFKMPYFYDVAKFRKGDLLILSSQSGYGKTHLAINIIKKLVEQNIKPYYLSRESGSRFTDIALSLGLKEGDFSYIYCIDPTKIEFEKDSITIIDWILPKDYAKTDQLFARLTDQAEKTQSVIIAFVQLRTNGEWYAKDQIEFFPALTAKYFYDDENDGTYGRFELRKIRERRSQVKKRDIPCKFNWETKELIRVDELEKKKKIREVEDKVKEVKIDNIKEDLPCDFNQCKSNNDGICKASSLEECPKNNEQAIYEDEKLIKSPKRKRGRPKHEKTL